MGSLYFEKSCAVAPVRASTTTIRTQWIYARSLWGDRGRGTLDDRREAVTMLEEMERAACRVLGPSHPTSIEIGLDLKKTREAPRFSNAFVLAVAVAVVALLWRYFTNE